MCYRILPSYITFIQDYCNTHCVGVLRVTAVDNVQALVELGMETVDSVLPEVGLLHSENADFPIS